MLTTSARLSSTSGASQNDRAMAKEPITVEVPDEPQQVGWGKVGGFAAAGFVLGIAWPVLAGITIGTRVPGAEDEAKPAASAKATSSAAAAPKASAPVKPKLMKASSAKAADREQTVVVGKGLITHCYKGRDKLKGEECGALRVDKVLVPQLQQLKGCPSAMGLAGEVELRFDLDFKGQEIRVSRGRKSDIPSSTLNGVVRCLADYIRDVSPEKIPHKYQKYRVAYSLKFYPPGAAPSSDPETGEAGDEDNRARGLAAVAWDVGLVRDEPETGKVVVRLVRGTRVKLLGRRKDWYRVKVRSKEGWIYRGALGM